MDGVDVTVIGLLSSAVSKVNMISLCLPDDLQENIEEVKSNVISVLNDFGCNDIVLNEAEQLPFLDKVSLYTTLNSIFNDLGICTLITSNNVKLEDSLYNVHFIMKKMAEYDSVFRYCYVTIHSLVKNKHD